MTTRKMGNDTLGRERRRDLRDRVSEIRQAAWRSTYQPKPPEVIAAEKIVNAYNKRVAATAGRRRDAILVAAKAAARELLSTDSFDAGLRIVAKLEATARRRGWLSTEKESQE